MPKELLFWILMLFWAVSWLFFELRPVAGQPYPFHRVPGALLMFILFAILGWHDFGPPIH